MINFFYIILSFCLIIYHIIKGDKKSYLIFKNYYRNEHNFYINNPSLFLILKWGSYNTL